MSDSRDQANREIVERFFAASERGDRPTLLELLHDDVVMTWPQSGERFRGPDNMLGAMGAIPVKPEFAAPPRLVGSGAVWVLMAPLRYPDGVWDYVAVLELEDGRIRRATGYWGEPFPAQPSRAAFAESPTGDEGSAGT
jgi:SnoaL-like domain